MNIIWVRVILFLVSVGSIFGIYKYWEKDIQDTLLAKLRLDALQQSVYYQAEAKKESEQRIVQLEKDARAYENLSRSLGQYIRGQVDENSCLVKPIGDNDARVLNEAFNKESGN